MPSRPLALLTYSTKPRGGVVHTLEVAEALSDVGVDVRVVALGDPAHGFFRPVRVPVTLVPGPAGEIAGVCADVRRDGGPQVVAYLLGTEGDPQVYSAQRATLEAAGCLVPETNARAAYVAAALARWEPALSEAGA